jgi:hypothetical protein
VSDPARPNPFSLVFGALAAERFPGLQSGIAAAGYDPRNRDAFLMVREVVELLHELRPEESFGDLTGTMAAFLHQAYLFWMAREPVRAVSEEMLVRALSREPGPPPVAPAAPTTRYVQLPPLRVWGAAVDDASAEPLDGWFESPDGPRKAVLAIFGLHPGRPGFTAVEVAGQRPENLQRPDGSPLFQAALPGGEAAGLASLVGAEELLELAWRISP